MRITCSAPGQGINTTQTQWDTDTGMPILKNPDFPVEVPNVYEDLPTPGYGIYAYRGGLTTPPCTELVNWNLLDTPLYASRAQVRRLYDIILCFTEPTTCNHATIANEQGTTSRPVQPLLDRTVLHRCFDGPESEERMGVPVPLAPVQDYVHSQTRRCVFNSENGGPLQVCWQDTVLGHFMLYVYAFPTARTPWMHEIKQSHTVFISLALSCTAFSPCLCSPWVLSHSTFSPDISHGFRIRPSCLYGV